MAVLRGDPTRTTMLRRAFMRDIRKRFRVIRRAIIELIVTLDVFGLEDRRPSPLALNVVAREWEFQTTGQKLESFRAWLQEQVDQNILTPFNADGDPWTATYIESAYKKGTSRAFIDARGATAAQNIEFFEGTRQEFLRAAFAQPERVSKIRLLATRSFEDLRGVTETMGRQLNRTLSTGLAQGQGPREIARVMDKEIVSLTRRRANVIARTEIIHAHSEGQLDSFQDLGVDILGVMAEWSTAGDDRVCPNCADMEGKTFTVDEARGLIPLHPNCRCAWIPAV